MDNQQAMSQFELGWLSGIIDGEGCFGLHHLRTKGYEYLRPSLSLANTDARIITRIVEDFEKLGIPYYICKQKARHAGQKNAQMIQVPGIKRVKRLLDALYPYLGVKKQQAAVLQEYVALRLSKPQSSPYGEDEEKLRLKLKDLNQRGTSEPQRLHA